MQRKAALDAVKETEKYFYEANKNKWMEKRELLKNYTMLPAERQRTSCQLNDIKRATESNLDNHALYFID